MVDRKQRGKGPAPKKPDHETTHIADEPVSEADSLGATVQSPTTETGLPVEEQVRKTWDPTKDGGLPTSLRGSAR